MPRIFSALNFTGVEAALDTTIARRHQLEFQYTGLNGAQDALAGSFLITRSTTRLTAALCPGHQLCPPALWREPASAALERYARDPYALLDLYAASTRGKVHPFLQLSNATGTTYQEIIGVPMPGRAVEGGLEWTVLTRK